MVKIKIFDLRKIYYCFLKFRHFLKFVMYIICTWISLSVLEYRLSSLNVYLYNTSQKWNCFHEIFRWRLSRSNFVRITDAFLRNISLRGHSVLFFLIFFYTFDLFAEFASQGCQSLNLPTAAFVKSVSSANNFFALDSICNDANFAFFAHVYLPKGWIM